MNNNYCCSCGKLFEHWFHGQGWICETCKEWGITREEIAPTFSEVLSNGKESRLGGGILFTDGKQILLMKRAGDCDFVDHWCIPGGKAKTGESPKEVAHREAKEECGSNEGKQFGQFVSPDLNRHFHTFLLSVKPFAAKLSDEHSDAKWVDLDDVGSLKLHPKFEKSWPTFLKMIKERFPDKVSFSDWFTIRIS